MAGTDEQVDNVTCVDLQDWFEKCSESAPGLSSLRSGFVMLLKLFFSSPDMLGPWRDALACLPANKLKIYAGSSVDPGDTENVPSIVVSTGDGVQVQRPWLRAPQGNMGGDFSTDINMYISKVTIHFKLRHYDSDIADMMADALMMLIIGSEQQVRRTWTWVSDYVPMAQVEAKRARQATDPDAFEDWYEASVTLELTYVMAVAVRMESKRIAEIVDKQTPRLSDRHID